MSYECIHLPGKLLPADLQAEKARLMRHLLANPSDVEAALVLADLLEEGGDQTGAAWARAWARERQECQQAG